MTTHAKSTRSDTRYSVTSTQSEGLPREIVDDPAFATFFWARVRRGAPGSCWLWTASLTAGGYGQFALSLAGRQRRFFAHRLAYLLANGSIPAGTRPDGKRGAVVRHDCDTPACCNPAHLRLGTQRDNVHDAIARGRGIGRPRRQPCSATPEVCP